MAQLTIRAYSFAAAFALLTACNHSAGQDNDSTPAPNFVEAQSRLEDSGAVPKLDRSTSIAGPDANNNKVRDDIEKYINDLPDTAAQKSALMQLASAMNAALTADTSSQSSVKGAAKEIDDGISCIYRRYTGKTPDQRVDEIEKYTVNTKERFDAYDRFNSAMSGSTSLLQAGDRCAN